MRIPIGSRILVPVACAVVLSCASLEGLVEKPRCKVTGVALKGLDLRGVELVFDVEVGNPYSVDLPLLGLDWDLAHQGRSFLAGRSDDAGRVPAKGSRTVPVAARVEFVPAMQTLGSVRPGQVVDWLARIGVTVDAPGLGELRVPLERSGSFPVPAVPEVSLAGVRWEKLTLGEAAAVMELSILNTNEFPVDLKRLAYDLKLGGIAVAKSAADPAASYAPGEARPLALRFSLRPSDLGLAAFNVLAGKGAGYEMAGSLDLDTAFGAMSLPWSSRGNTSFSK